MRSSFMFKLAWIAMFAFGWLAAPLASANDFAIQLGVYATAPLATVHHVNNVNANVTMVVPDRATRTTLDKHNAPPASPGMFGNSPATVMAYMTSQPVKRSPGISQL